MCNEIAGRNSDPRRMRNELGWRDAGAMLARCWRDAGAMKLE
jgi:hypothetical protein